MMDTIVLLSGGIDSTVMLANLLQMHGLEVLHARPIPTLLAS
jgi:7-cyano-7-deazaguanine synthase in queuosine biosynthesis